MCQRGEAVRGDVGIKSRGLMAAGEEVLHEKKQATQRRGVMSTLFCFLSQGENAKEEDNLMLLFPRSNHGEAEG